MEDIKIFLKKKKEKRDTMIKNITKISQNVRKIIWLSIETNIIECEKTPFYNYKKHLF